MLLQLWRMRQSGIPVMFCSIRLKDTLDHDSYLDVLEFAKPVESQVADGASPEFHPDKLAYLLNC